MYFVFERLHLCNETETDFSVISSGNFFCVSVQSAKAREYIVHALEWVLKVQFSTNSQQIKLVWPKKTNLSLVQ